MFIGHYAVGFASKKITPKTSLGTLVAAAIFLDLLWPLFLVLGLEHVRIVPGITAMAPFDFYDYPWSHSLLMAIVWGLIAGIIYFLKKPDKSAAWIIGLGVISHWFLDLPMHRPDLPLVPNGTILWGFGIWNHPLMTLIFEFLIFSAGLTVYLKNSNPKDSIGKFGLAVMIGLLLMFWILNFYGPPPPNGEAIGIVANAQWLFVAMAAWIDRHRTFKI